MEKNNLKESIVKAGKGLWNTFPIILGTILFISLIITLIPKSFYVSLFGGNLITDSLIGSLIGSVSAGSPITSYIIGGELLEQGIGIIAVTAFLVAWVTVGIVQLPAESIILGRKFAILRNLTSFIFAIIVAILTFFALNLI
jgi:uncharacterized membrane protein YraQ (UPF0718 family)